MRKKRIKFEIFFTVVVKTAHDQARITLSLKVVISETSQVEIQIFANFSFFNPNMDLGKKKKKNVYSSKRSENHTGCLYSVRRSSWGSLKSL